MVGFHRLTKDTNCSLLGFIPDRGWLLIVISAIDSLVFINNNLDISDRCYDRGGIPLLTRLCYHRTTPIPTLLTEVTLVNKLSIPYYLNMAGEYGEELKPDTLFVAGLRDKSSEQLEQLYEVMGSIGLSWQLLPDAAVSTVNESSSLQEILADERYASAPITGDLMREFTVSVGSAPSINPWATLMYGLALKHRDVGDTDVFNTIWKARLGTMPDIEVHLEIDDDQSETNKWSFIASPEYAELVWMSFGDLVTLTNWIDANIFHEPGTANRRLPIYGMGVKRLEILKQFIDHMAQVPEDLLLLEKPAARPAAMQEISSFQYDPDSPYIDRHEVHGQIIDVVSPDSIRRYLRDTRPGKKNYRTRLMTTSLAKQWKLRDYHNGSPEYKESLGMMWENVELNPEDFHYFPGEHGEIIILLSVPKFLETVYLMSRPLVHRDRISASSGIGSETLGIMQEYARAILKPSTSSAETTESAS